MSSPASEPDGEYPSVNRLPAEMQPELQQPLPGMPGVSDDYELRLERAQFHSGPLPTPESLAGYNEIDPSFANRIFAMAESEQKHRHEIEKTESTEPYRLARRGQVIALVVVVLVLAFGAYLVSAGSAVAGSIIVGIDLLGLVTVFVTGQMPVRRSDESQKPPPDEDPPAVEPGA